MRSYKEKRKKKINKILLNQNTSLRLLDKVIIITLIVILSIIMIMTNITIKQSKANQKKFVQDYIEIFSAKQRNIFESYINNKIEILKYIASFSEIYGMNQMEQKRFIEGRSELIGFEHIFIVDKNGVGYYVDENVFRIQEKEPFFKDIMSNDIFITKPFIKDCTNNNIIMTLCVSLYNEDHEKVGVLCGAISLFEIQKTFFETGFEVNGIYSVVDRNGYYMSDNNMKLVENKVSIFNIKNSDVSLIKRALDEKATLMGTIILDEGEYLACVSYLDMYDLAMIIGLKTEYILKDLDSIDKYRRYINIFNLLLIICIIRIIVSIYLNNKKMHTDILTKCSNRSAIETLIEKLDNIIEYKISVVYLDLNKFKEINDTYGHEMGDKVLCFFSNLLLSIFGQHGFVGRIGGDEFVCIFIDISQSEILELLYELHLMLKQGSNNLKIKYNLSSSYGIAFREKGSRTSIRDIIKKADKNMYEYKMKHT